MDKEIWKDIEGYEGLYQVSNLGRVRSLDRYVNGKNGTKCYMKGNFLKPALRGGYLFVCLFKNNKPKSHSIHRLVAQAFIPNPEKKPCVNHRNCVKFDNNVENLEWCTQKENIQHALDNNLISTCERKYNSKLTNEQVKRIRKEYIYGSYEFGSNALARKYGVTQATIHNIITNKTYKNID